MEKDKVINRLRSYFENRRTVSTEEMRQYFRRDRPDLDEEALKQKITEMEQAGIIRRSKGEQFTFPVKLPFRPVAGSHYKELTGHMEDHHEGLYCLTATQWVNEISTHNQPQRAVLLEAEPPKLPALFDELRKKGIGEIHLLKDTNEKGRLHVDWAGEPTILMPLVEEAPVQRVDEVWTPTLEKMLVDLYCDPELFPGIDPEEMVSIFDNAFHLYDIDYGRFQAYARKRHRLNDLESYLRSVINPAFTKVSGE